MKTNKTSIIIISGLVITVVLVIAMTAPNFLLPPKTYIPTANSTE